MNPSARVIPSGMRAALQAAAIVLAAAWIYGPVLHGSWLWDDGLEIVRNPQLTDAMGWWKAWTAPAGMDYLPLKSTFQWLEWHLWGGEVTGYHLINLSLHILSALLLWRLLDKLGVRHGWVGGLLFAVHPVAVESVAWISEFKNTLSLPPLLLACGAYVDWDARGRWGDYFRSLAWFLAALLCKSSVVMLPFGLLLFAVWRRGRIGWADARASVPFFALSLGAGAVTLWFQHHRAIGLTGPMPAFGTRLAQTGWSAAAYLQDAVFPAGLMPIYPTVLRAWPALLPWLGFAALFAVCWTRRTSWGKSAAFGLGWFLIHLAPVLGFFALSYLRVAPRADHLAYLPLTGIVGLAAAGFSAGIDALGAGAAHRLSRAVSWGAAAGVIAILAVSSHAYAGIFRNEETLWTEALRRNPRAWIASANLGRIELEAGRPAEAANQLEAAGRLGPDSAEVRTNLGNAYARLGRTSDARTQYETAVRIDPEFAGAHYNLGVALLGAGETARARDEFRSALRIDSGYAAAHNDLGLALARLGQMPDAVAEYQRALTLEPRLPEAHLNLGNALFRLGQLPEAVAQYRAALAIDPGYRPAHQNLGMALERLGQHTAAQAEFSAAALSGRPQ
jgi:tetratricopeptide (TPR) repeat protein